MLDCILAEPKLVPLYFPALTEGDSHIALCQTKGGDKPIQLSWYKNGQLITSNSFPFLIVKVCDVTFSFLFQFGTLQHSWWKTT